MSGQPRVIKAGQLPNVRAAQFNTVDTLEELQRQLDQARAQVEAYKKDAHAEIQKLYDRVNKEAWDKGYKDGFEKGSDEARQKGEAEHQSKVESDVNERLETTTQSLRQAIDQFAAERGKVHKAWLGEWEQTALRFVTEMARKVVRRELQDPSGIARQALAEAIRSIGSGSQVVIHLSPRDAETLDMSSEDFRLLNRGIDKVRIVTDPRMTPGGCLVQTEYGEIDATIETQLRRIEEELLGNPEDDDESAEEEAVPPTESAESSSEEPEQEEDPIVVTNHETSASDVGPSGQDEEPSPPEERTGVSTEELEEALRRRPNSQDDQPPILT
ncbi:FliH/SctL family protein [Kolteria novifilia]